MARNTLGKSPRKDVTLSLDTDIYDRAKLYAKTHRKSVSQLVNELLDRIPDEEPSKDEGPGISATPSMRKYTIPRIVEGSVARAAESSGPYKNSSVRKK